MTLVRASRLALILSFVAIVLSCGSAPIGYGVVLWAPDGSDMESGELVTVIDESEITDTFTVVAADGSESILPRWRIDFFEVEADAAARADNYVSVFDGNTGLMARATRNALPIRSDPEATSTNTVYRLRLDEEIKLVGRQAEETDLEGLISFWYEALTTTGERGWVFGYTLEVYDPADPSIVQSGGRTEDPFLDLLLNNIWRPIYYVDMIANDAIDLELFRIEHGLFPDPASNTFELVLPAHAELFGYDRVTRVGNRRYIAEGTSLSFTFQRGDELSLQYNHDGESYVIAMQRIEVPIEEYIEAESARREEIYQQLLDFGPNYQSDNYGTLNFESGQRFTWGGYDRLVPSVVPASASALGRVELGLFLERSLGEQFDGALQFLFSGASTPASFAYAIEPLGIRLVWIPPDDIEDRLVTRVGANTLTIFMSSAAN